MTGAIDVGDAFELAFGTVTGAEVTVTWLDPNQTPVFSDVTVTEDPPGSGSFPYTFLPTSPGIWTVQFRASGAATQFEQYWIRASSVTGPAPLAVLGDVQAQFGTMTEAQEGIAKHLLRAASKIVRARVPDLDALVAEGRLDPEVVALGIVNMVLRVLRNPRGLRAESTGPFSRAYDVSTAAGQLVVTAADELLFTPAPATSAVLSGVGTIRVTPGLVPAKSSRWYR